MIPVPYVIDTSALIQAYVADIYSTQARTLLQRSQLERSVALHVIDFALAECLNIIWKRVVFLGLAETDAKRAVRSLTLTQLTIHPSLPYYSRALEIGIAYHLPTYDSLCIALAENLGFELIAYDGKLEKIASAIGIRLKSLTDFS